MSPSSRLFGHNCMYDAAKSFDELVHVARSAEQENKDFHEILCVVAAQIHLIRDLAIIHINKGNWKGYGFQKNFKRPAKWGTSIQIYA